jgi:hypothetical protein
LGSPTVGWEVPFEATPGTFEPEPPSDQFLSKQRFSVPPLPPVARDIGALPAAGVPLQLVLLLPLAPGCPTPAVTVARVKVAFAPLTNTAMLDAAVPFCGGVDGALCAVKAKSSKTTPLVLVPVISSANPAADGATVVGVDALYAQDEQLRPPYTVTPSSAAVTTTPVVNVPHAYTRFVPPAATDMPCPIVAYGASLVPLPPESLPVGETNTPRPSATTHGSLEGSSPLLKQVAPHAW